MAPWCYSVTLLCYWGVAFLSDTLVNVDTGILCPRMGMGLSVHWGLQVIATIRQLFKEEHGQDVAEYAVMLAVILVIVIGTVRLIGGNANNVFSQVQSQLSQ